MSKRSLNNLDLLSHNEKVTALYSRFAVGDFA